MSSLPLSPSSTYCAYYMHIAPMLCLLMSSAVFVLTLSTPTVSHHTLPLLSSSTTPMATILPALSLSLSLFLNVYSQLKKKEGSEELELVVDEALEVWCGIV